MTSAAYDVLIIAIHRWPANMPTKSFEPARRRPGNIPQTHLQVRCDLRKRSMHCAETSLRSPQQKKGRALFIRYASLVAHCSRISKAPLGWQMYLPGTRAHSSQRTSTAEQQATHNACLSRTSRMFNTGSKCAAHQPLWPKQGGRWLT